MRVSRAGICKPEMCHFGGLSCWGFFSGSVWRLNGGDALKLHVLLCVVRINKPTSSLPALSRLSKIMRRGLQSFNCIVRTTATYCFRKRPHIEQVTRKVNLFKTRKKPFSLSLLLTWHFNYAVLSDRCGDRAHVKVRAWPLLISYDIFLYSGCR